MRLTLDRQDKCAVMSESNPYVSEAYEFELIK